MACRKHLEKKNIEFISLKKVKKEPILELLTARI